ncbi:peptide ABC transporter substrate-binding protein, partial [Limosilactobacillus mucosae]
LTADILKGKKKPSTTAIKYIRHGEPVLNLKQARKLGLHVPASFQREAEKYGEVIK